MNKAYEHIKQLSSNYTKQDTPLLKNTIDMLCQKGFANGIYQDYKALADLITVLDDFVDMVKENE